MRARSPDRPASACAGMLTAFPALMAAVFLAACDPAPQAPRTGAIDVAEAEVTGVELFRQHGCMVCHGEDGRGDGPLAASLDPAPRDFHDPEAFLYGGSVGEIMVTLELGLLEQTGGMPSYSHLPAEELRKLAQLIHGMRPGAESEGAGSQDPNSLHPDSQDPGSSAGVAAETVEIAGVGGASDPNRDGKKLLRFEEIGGDFELVDHRGEPFQMSAAAGRVRLLFFGYASCPDFCPQTLSKIARVRRLLDPEAREALLPLFVSVDPGRDTPEKLAAYMEYFNLGDALALTGTPEQIDAVVGSFKGTYEVDPGEQSGDRYTVAHTSYLYLIDAEGVTRAIFRHSEKAETLAEAVGLAVDES